MIQKTAIYPAFLLLCISAFTSSCDTDVDLNAPYKVTPVIVGVLDAVADTQFFRINRTFLSAENASLYAGIRDSVEYADGEVDAWLVKLNSSNRVDSFQLQAIDLPTRAPGVFYDGNVRFFYTAEPLFSNDQERINGIDNINYEIRVAVRGEVYTARTNFPRVGPGDITNPLFSVDTTRSNFVIEGTPITGPFSYVTRESGARYQGDLVLVYDEELNDGTITPRKELVYPLGTFLNQGSQLTGTRSFAFQSLNWFTFVGNEFQNTPNLKKVRIRYLLHRLTVANGELNTYLNVINPVSQFIPVFNSYTNLDNGAIGILGTTNKLERAVFLEETTMIFLTNNEVSTGPCYCGYWTGTAFTCDQSASGCP